jgi:4-hydroxy-3-polyprenylbenzoate decarboxylase
VYRNLREFTTALESAGELAHIHCPVSPILEISEIVQRQNVAPCPNVSEAARGFDPDHCGQGGRALLFENVEGCDFPLLINAYGSYRRTEMALGCTGEAGFEGVANRIGALAKPQPPSSLGDALRKARMYLPLLRVAPRRGGSGACQQVVRLTERGEVDLTRLPLMKCWPLDGDPEAVGFGMSAAAAGTAEGSGRYITFAGMHTVHADDCEAARPASHNIGMYRAQLVDATHLVMHWHVHHDGAAHWRSWKRAGRPMPIAICFGGESVLPYAATSPLPPGLSELLMAGFLNGRGIPMVRAQTVPLWVPANSEIVIEGYVHTDCGTIDFDPRTDGSLGPGAALEGPFGDHTDFYSLPDRYPIVNVTALTHRRDAVYPSTIVGLPPQEDYYLGKATERIFLPLLQTLISDIDDYHLPMFGCFHNCAFLRIDKSYPLQARRIMHAVWGAGQMAWTKLIVVVDDDVNVHDEEAVLAAIFEHCHFQRDLEVVNGPLDILDHAAPRLGAGHKLGIDATRKIPGEEVGGVGTRVDVRAGIDLEQVRSSLPGADAPIERAAAPAFGRGRCVFVAVRKERAGQGAEAIESVWAAVETGADFVIAVDATVDVADWQQVLFHMCANADPGRDLIRSGHRAGIDATAKTKGDERNGQPVRDYPPILEMTADVRRRVDDRWGEYGLRC